MREAQIIPDLNVKEGKSVDKCDVFYSWLLALQFSRVLVWRCRFCFKNRSVLMSTAVGSQQPGRSFQALAIRDRKAV